MEDFVALELGNEKIIMQLLRPSVHKIYKLDKSRKAGEEGLHTHATARFLAVMRTCNIKGIICATHSGNLTGLILEVLVCLSEEKRQKGKGLILALFAASAIGLIVTRRATFAAETAVCQVEINVVAAMVAAARVETSGSMERQTMDAPAITLHNYMGSICDTDQGTYEMPSHMLNAIASSSVFVCAGLIQGGYDNPTTLDETIDAILAVGKAIPSKLQCTSRGGLAITPPALRLERGSE